MFSYLEEEGKIKKKIKKECFGLKYGGHAGALMGQRVVPQDGQAAGKNFRAGTGVVLSSWWKGEGRSGRPAASTKYVAFTENMMPKLSYEWRHPVFPQFPRFFCASGFRTEAVCFLCP